MKISLNHGMLVWRVMKPKAKPSVKPGVKPSVKTSLTSSDQPTDQPTGQPIDQYTDKPRVHGSTLLWVALGLCLLTLLAYSNSFGAGFALDNRGLILEDTRIREASPENLARIFQHTYWWPYGESGLYRPLTTLSYLFNYATLGGGTAPAGYHWINFLLHAANVLLVYALGLRLTDGGSGPAWIAAIWAVHPLLTECVTNIVGRADLLAGFAVLSGFLIYLKSTEATGARRGAWLALLALVTAAGVFAKESGVTVLGVIALYEAIFWKQRRQALGLVLGSIAMLIPIQAMLYQRAAVLFSSQATTFPFYDNPITAAGWLVGRLTALKVIGKYLGLLIWPARLSCDYSWSQIPLAGGSALDFAWWLLPAAAIGVAAVLLRRNRTGLWIAGAAILVFLPTSNLLFPIGTIMAERFLYLPAIASSAAVIAAVNAVAAAATGRLRAPWFLPAVLAVIVAASAARTWARNADWQSDLTLATATVAVSPESYKSHLMLANSLFEAGPARDNTARDHIDRVLAEAEKSLAILLPLPLERNNPRALRIVAMWYLSKADLIRPGRSAAGSPEAAQACRRAIELFQRCRTMVQAQFAVAAKRPGFDPKTNPLAAAPADVDRLISSAYLKLGDTGRALDLSAGAIDVDPGNPEAYRQYAQSLIAAGRSEQAIAILMEGVMLTLDPGLRQSVVDLYQSGADRGGCALVPGQNGSMALNPGCGTVHAQLCAATAAAIQLRLKGGRKDLAGQLKDSGVKDFGCPAAALDAALAVR
jgi:tetratricopeptide (TPR) repeat protein